MIDGLRGFPLLKIDIRNEHDIVTVRQKSRHAAELLGFKAQDQSRLATAVSELARNVFQYARGGVLEFSFRDLEPQTLFVRVTDSGPGIADLNLILSGAYQSPTGMGIGLAGTKKLMDVFDVQTGASGTAVTIGRARTTRNPVVDRKDLPRIAELIARAEPTTAFEEIQHQNRDLIRALDELRISQEELKALNRELSETNRGVVALYAELDEKAASLQRANEIKTRFLSNMTHEFRTPLGSIISLTNILQMHVDGPLTVEQERQVQYIRQSGESLLGLVNDLLDLAKVEAGKVAVDAVAFSIEDLMGGLRGMFKPIVGADADVTLTVDWDPSIAGLFTDQGKVSQVLRNLISNALKFTARGSVAVDVYAEGAEAVHFTVSDTGIGVAEGDLTMIFADYGQVASPVNRGRGTGLGLPLSRRLAELLGGKLWVNSEIGRGSTFHFVVPKRYAGAAEAVLIPYPVEPPSPCASSGKDRFDVLIIDDDEPSRYVVKGLVTREIDACFTEAAGGREGLDRLSGPVPDLIILDLNMRGLDGFEVLREVKNRPGLVNVPIIVNTARDLSEPERIVLASETVAVLSKERSDDEIAVGELRRALAKAGFDYKGM